MSLITRCPACGTMFKVVADQLRVSQGWVRCGHCSDVFDAGSHLQAVNPAPLPLPEVAAQSFPKEADVSVVDELSVPAAALSEKEPARNEPAVVDPVPPPDEDVTDLVAALPDTTTHADTKSPADPRADEPVAAFHDVSFLRQARREAFWKKTSVRAVTGALGLVLLALLGLQYVLQYKDSLALIDPRWSPVLQAVCQPLNCAVKPLRRVESLVIDSSSFSKSGPDSFRLSFVLKNMADLPLEAPLLELTLTDTQDKAILRRVLTPAQFGYSDGVLLPARAEVAGVVSLTVTSEGNRPAAVSAVAVAGYRVLVFYP